MVDGHVHIVQSHTNDSDIDLEHGVYVRDVFKPIDRLFLGTVILNTQLLNTLNLYTNSTLSLSNDDTLKKELVHNSLKKHSLSH